MSAIGTPSTTTERDSVEARADAGIPPTCKFCGKVGHIRKRCPGYFKMKASKYEMLSRELKARTSVKARDAGDNDSDGYNGNGDDGSGSGSGSGSDNDSATSKSSLECSLQGGSSKSKRKRLAESIVSEDDSRPGKRRSTREKPSEDNPRVRKRGSTDYELEDEPRASKKRKHGKLEMPDAITHKYEDDPHIIGVCCTDGILLAVAQKPKSAFSNKATRANVITTIDENIIIACTGSPRQIKCLLEWISALTWHYRNENGKPIMIDLLTKHVDRAIHKISLRIEVKISIVLAGVNAQGHLDMWAIPSDSPQAEEFSIVTLGPTRLSDSKLRKSLSLDMMLSDAMTSAAGLFLEIYAKKLSFEPEIVMTWIRTGATTTQEGVKPEEVPQSLINEAISQAKGQRTMLGMTTNFTMGLWESVPPPIRQVVISFLTVISMKVFDRVIGSKSYRELHARFKDTWDILGIVMARWMYNSPSSSAWRLCIHENPVAQCF